MSAVIELKPLDFLCARVAQRLPVRSKLSQIWVGSGYLPGSPK